MRTELRFKYLVQRSRISVEKDFHAFEDDLTSFFLTKVISVSVAEERASNVSPKASCQCVVLELRSKEVHLSQEAILQIRRSTMRSQRNLRASILHASDDESVPQRIHLVAAVVHKIAHVAVDLLGRVRAVVIQTVVTLTSKGIREEKAEGPAKRTSALPDVLGWLGGRCNHH